MAMNIGLLTLALPLAAGPAPAPAVVPPAPILFVKVIPPEGAKTTYLPGTPAARAYAEPVTVGMRPGYTYRVAITGLPGHPREVLTPTIEVRGALCLAPPAGNPAHFPVALVLNQEDIDIALGGGMITKVLYLEDPEFAAGIATTADRPLEMRSICEEDALTEARVRGRVVVILRFGERTASMDELAMGTVPGTLLLPGEVMLPAPAAPPFIPWGKFLPFDPILGPKPLVGECLHDGGDSQTPLGIGPDGRVAGLDASDAAIEYTTPAGKRVQPSNRVCLCVPRYAALRVVQVPAGTVLITAPAANHIAKGLALEKLKQPSLQVENLKTPLAMKGRERPSAEVGGQAPLGLEALKGHTQVVANVEGVKETFQLKIPEDVTAYPQCKLMLHKWVEPKTANIGDTVTFFLRYSNPGTKPMTQVAVSDSLTPRLEYIPGTAKSDREAVCTITPNEAGSVVLRWEIAAPVEPGQFGVVSFQAKIR
jgi:uncharacterized repeat protein (TIGR01451 family)